MATVAPVLEMVGDFAACLEAGEDEAAVMAIRRSRSTGRPVGSADWLEALEAAAGRPLAAARLGPRPKAEQNRGLWAIKKTIRHRIAPASAAKPDNAVETAR